jgi:hyaluronoglucosaminidase
MSLQLGVIEGFYGEPWSHEARLAMADWLPALGLDLYLYAPKRDRFLRRDWRSDWPPAERLQLEQIARRCDDVGLSFAIGLSPFALHESYGAFEKRELQRRVREIESLGASVLALLFDDMPGSAPALARVQGQIVQDVAAVSGAQQLLVCPTYYSDDPALDRFFGNRPAGYLAELGAQLPHHASLLWTGPLVCSPALAVTDLPAPAERGGAALSLWDNYPVNDSRLRSPHLYLQPLRARQPELAERVAGHYCNAMNQPALSLPALAGLPALYGRSPGEDAAVFRDAGLTPELRAAAGPLAQCRVEELDREQLRRLEREAAADSMAARELRAFLNGEYRFDPACLND